MRRARQPLADWRALGAVRAGPAWRSPGDSGPAAEKGADSSVPVVGPR